MNAKKREQDKTPIARRLDELVFKPHAQLCTESRNLLIQVNPPNGRGAFYKFSVTPSAATRAIALPYACCTARSDNLFHQSRGLPKKTSHFD
ncbi:hypothetical protein [Salinisphaera sp. C84B14]|uniref:hypothetical protein n=1 Tax=Salinisphaera sp. C84B14 TaxID=1304155 RepID=UPI00333F5704